MEQKMVKKYNQIYGLIMQPCFTNQQDFANAMQGSKFGVTQNFYDEYRNHIAAMEIIAECAKVYILNNYKNITDWTNLEVVAEDNGHGRKGKPFIEYYNYKPTFKNRKSAKRSNALEKIFYRLDEDNKKRHNPAKTVTDVFLDTTDGDFSLTINGNKHNWISDSTVIIIADFIEKQLASASSATINQTEL